MSRHGHSWETESRWKMIAALIVVAMAFAPVVALAKVGKGDIRGVDYVYPDVRGRETSETPEEGYVDLLSIRGEEDDIVFVKLTQEDRTLVSHLPFRLGQLGTDEKGRCVGVLSMELDNMPSDATTFGLGVYGDRRQVDELYSGTVIIVFGAFEAPGGTKVRPIMVRTADAEETKNRGDIAPEHLEYSGQVYELASKEPTNDPDGKGRMVFLYKLEDDAPAKIEGHVTYMVLGSNDQIRQETVELMRGQEKHVDVPDLVDSGSAFYRTMQVGNKVSLSYPGASERVIYCKKIEDNDFGDQGAPYTVNISYVDKDASTTILTDQLVVTSAYNYAPPTKLYTKDGEGTSREYTLVSDTGDLESANGGSAAVLHFELDQAKTELRTESRTIYYRDTTKSAGRTWAIECRNGADNGNNALLKTVTLGQDSVPGGLVYHPDTLTVGGTTYVPAHSSVNLPATGGVTTVWYVPKGGKAANKDYTVTVRYVDANDITKVLGTQSETITYAYADANGVDQPINVPKTLRSGAYELVAGQLFDESDTDGYMVLRHSYYNKSQKTYTLLYRDVNAAQTATVVTVRTIDDGTTVTDSGVVRVTETSTVVTDDSTEGSTTSSDGTQTRDGTDADGDTDCTEANDDGQAAESNDSKAKPAGNDETALDNRGGLRAVETDNGPETIRDNGTDTGTERIDDDDNPLAVPDIPSAADAGADAIAEEGKTVFGMSVQAAVGIVVASFLAAGGVFIYLRRMHGSVSEDI